MYPYYYQHLSEQGPYTVPNYDIFGHHHHSKPFKVERAGMGRVASFHRNLCRTNPISWRKMCSPQFGAVRFHEAFRILSLSPCTAKLVCDVRDAFQNSFLHLIFDGTSFQVWHPKWSSRHVLQMANAQGFDTFSFPVQVGCAAGHPLPSRTAAGTALQRKLPWRAVHLYVSSPDPGARRASREESQK